ncbi:MAG: plasmid mobilization relaxosome protein MobC [Crocinitomicaceae bacterium]
MARPKKEHTEKLTKHLPAVRCSESEYASIQARAAQASMTVSEFVRQMALNGKVVIKESQADFELMDQLRRIGVNLNQLTRKAHVRGEFPEGLRDVYEQLQSVFDKLLTSA